MLVPSLPSLSGGVITREEFAAMLRVCTITIDRMHKAGAGPKRMRLSPRRVGYRLDDVNAWLAARGDEEAADGQ